MTLFRTLDDRTVEALLAGRTPRDREDLAALAALLAKARSVGHGAPPRPSDALAAVMAQGLPAAAGPVRRSTASPRRRSAPTRVRALFGSIVLKLAGLGLAAKAFLVLTATAAVAIAAAATDLPQTVSESVGGEDPAPAASLPEAPSPADVTRDAGRQQDAGGGPPAASEQPSADSPQDGNEQVGNDDVPPAGSPSARDEAPETPSPVPSEGRSGAGNGQGPPTDPPRGPPTGTPTGPPTDPPPGPPTGTPQGPPGGTPPGRPTEGP